MDKKALPGLFLENMKNLFSEFGLGHEYGRFIQSFQEEPLRGIRLNALKIQTEAESETILRQMVFETMPGHDPDQNTDNNDNDNDNDNNINIDTDTDIAENKTVLTRVPWSDDGYYIDGELFPGRHPFYLAGLFYVQEPSAMLPAHVLDAKPGDHILDLCAAPGGKTVKIAADLKGKGILIANDINETRVKALVRNVELAGCTNCVVLNESPEHIARRLPGYFDKILLDAPCSGEGMFRRDPGAMDSWEKFGNENCAGMQREILSHVDGLLKPGGILVYSTCTFSSIENEEMIGWFLRENPAYVVMPIDTSDGIAPGLSHKESLRRAVRIFPHRALGEGHFCAKLQKNSIPDGTENSGRELKNIVCKTNRKGKLSGKDSIGNDFYNFSITDFIDAFRLFSEDVLTTECINLLLIDFSAHSQMIRGHIYTLPETIPSMDDLKIAKKGLYLGELKEAKSKIRFEPSHSFLLSRKREDLLNPLSFKADDPILTRYLKGETLILPLGLAGQTADFPPYREPGRFIPICVQGYPIGWGKAMQGGMIKNLYPQGWRR